MKPGINSYLKAIGNQLLLFLFYSNAVEKKEER